MKNFQLQEVGKGNHDIRERRLFKSDLHHQRRSWAGIQQGIVRHAPCVAAVSERDDYEAAERRVCGLHRLQRQQDDEEGKEGSRQAGKLFRFHALWEVFLVEKLHFSWSEAHEQADGLEHQTSDMLAERLDEFLGHPEHCPHGDPIPKADGSRKGLTFRTLSDLKEGDSTTIRRIVEDYSLMDYLQEKGIHPDMRVTVKEKEPYEGPILLATEAGDISLSYKAVEQIFVDE